MILKNVESHFKSTFKAENNGTLAMDFFDHDPKAHAKKS